jgi:aminopeptidase N
MLLASVALAAALGGSALAQPADGRADTVDASLPTQLPRTAIPHHYALTVTPHASKLTFDGQVAIDLDLIKPTRTLTLNAADLAIAKATLTPSSGAVLNGRVSTDADAQTATFDFGRTVAPGKYRLEIVYSGKINTQANGLFALDYKNKEGKDARSLFTQFEAADARRVVARYCGRAQGSPVPDHADDVLIPAVLCHRRFRPHHQDGRQHRNRNRHEPRQWRQGAAGARRRGADPALLQ